MASASPLTWPGARNTLRNFFAALPVADARFIVDLGAETGRFARMLPSATREITAVEPDPAMAVEIECGGGEAIKVVCAFAERLPVCRRMRRPRLLRDRVPLVRLRKGDGRDWGSLLLVQFAMRGNGK